MNRPQGDREAKKSKSSHIAPILADVKKPVTRLLTVAPKSTATVVRAQCRLALKFSNGQELILGRFILAEEP